MENRWQLSSKNVTRQAYRSKVVVSCIHLSLGARAAFHIVSLSILRSARLYYTCSQLYYTIPWPYTITNYSSSSDDPLRTEVNDGRPLGQTWIIIRNPMYTGCGLLIPFSFQLLYVVRSTTTNRKSLQYFNTLEYCNMAWYWLSLWLIIMKFNDIMSVVPRRSVFSIGGIGTKSWQVIGNKVNKQPQAKIFRNYTVFWALLQQSDKKFV